MQGERSLCFPAAIKTCNTYVPCNNQNNHFFRIKYITENNNKGNTFTVHVLSKLRN